MEQVKVNIPLNTLKPRVCACGCDVFSPVVKLKEVSAIVSPNGKAGVIFVQDGFVCIKCGTPADLTPPKDDEKKIVLMDGGRA